MLYLVFNEGYSASAGDDLIRRDLCDRAAALARVLAELLPEDPEAMGLLALMLFHRARQAARVNDRGDLVTLEGQDRTLGPDPDRAGPPAPRSRPRRTAAWPVADPASRGRLPRRRADRAGHKRPRIARLYQHLADMTGSPAVELNRAVAVAMADGPAAGLALLQRLEADGALAGYYLLPATQADFLRRPGRNEEAASAYEEAAALAGTGPERRFLNARLGRSQDRSTPEPGQMGSAGPAAREPAIPGQSRVPSTPATC